MNRVCKITWTLRRLIYMGPTLECYLIILALGVSFADHDAAILSALKGYNLRCKLVFWCRQIETISDLSFTWFSFFAFIIASFSVRCHEAACAEVPLRGRFDLFVGLSNNSPSKRERITFCYSLTAIITLSAFCFAKGFAIVIELLFEWTLLHPRCKQLVYFC